MLLFTGVVDTREKFITGVVVTGDHCSAVSLTPVIYLSPVVSTTPPITENLWKKLIAGVVDTGDKIFSGVIDPAEQFIAGVVDTAEKHSFAIISANFWKKSNPNGTLRGPRDNDSWKKTEVENLVSDSL